MFLEFRVIDSEYTFVSSRYRKVSLNMSISTVCVRKESPLFVDLPRVQIAHICFP